MFAVAQLKDVYVEPHKIQCPTKYKLCWTFPVSAGDLLRGTITDFVRNSPLRRAKAEGEGFEPSIPFDRYTHFPGVPLQPLEHLSFVLPLCGALLPCGDGGANVAIIV